MIAFCPACGIERTDYEGVGAHLPQCPNCGSEKDPRSRSDWFAHMGDEAWAAYEEAQRKGW